MSASPVFSRMMLNGVSVMPFACAAFDIIARNLKFLSRQVTVTLQQTGVNGNLRSFQLIPNTSLYGTTTFSPFLPGYITVKLSSVEENLHIFPL